MDVETTRDPGTDFLQESVFPFSGKGIGQEYRFRDEIEFVFEIWFGFSLLINSRLSNFSRVEIRVVVKIWYETIVI